MKERGLVQVYHSCLEVVGEYVYKRVVVTPTFRLEERERITDNNPI